MNTPNRSKIIKMIISVIIGAFVIFILYIGFNMKPGSYVYAEHYQFNCTSTELITTIEDFKKENTEYCLPESSPFSGDKQIGRWYHIYFYYEQENEIVHTWVRASLDGKSTTFAFVSIHEGAELGGQWEQINHDFSRKENKAEKDKFEQRILNEIKKRVQYTKDTN